MKETIFYPIIITLTLFTLLCCLDIMFGQKEEPRYNSYPNSKKFLEGYPELVIIYDELMATIKPSVNEYDDFLKSIIYKNIILSPNEAVHIMNAFGSNKDNILNWGLFVEHCRISMNTQIDTNKTDQLIEIYG